jgi:hypothetical protein
LHADISHKRDSTIPVDTDTVPERQRAHGPVHHSLPEQITRFANTTLERLHVVRYSSSLRLANLSDQRVTWRLGAHQRLR